VANYLFLFYFSDIKDRLYLERLGAEAPNYAKRSTEPRPEYRGNKIQNNQAIDEELDFF